MKDIMRKKDEMEQEVSNKSMKITWFVTVMALFIIGFILSFPLIYYGGFIGAAITVTITRGLLGLSIMFRVKSHIKP